MKKYIMILVSLFTLATGLTFAQDSSLPIPSDGLQGFFVSLGAMIPLVTFLSGWINSKIKASGFNKQAVSWVVSVALSIIGWGFKLGMFAGIEWHMAAIYGLGIGLAANGLFDITIIKSVISAIFKPKVQTK